jgi:hypothetical protein
MDSVVSEVGAREVVNDMPRWDREAEQANQIVFEAWTLASERDFLEVSNELPSSVIWDEEYEHNLMHDNLGKNLALGTDSSVGEDWVSDKHKQLLIQDSVIWDDELIHNIDSHDGLLQKLARGGEFLDADE